MATLLHEMWEEPDGEGGWLEGLCLAGPDGDGFRKLLAPGSRCVRTFEAGSHFEAMTIYNRILGRAPYTTTFEQDYAPYPDDWAVRQRCL
jgi:hypothetical protein